MEQIYVLLEIPEIYKNFKLHMKWNIVIEMCYPTR